MKNDTMTCCLCRTNEIEVDVYGSHDPETNAPIDESALITEGAKWGEEITHTCGFKMAPGERCAICPTCVAKVDAVCHHDTTTTDATTGVETCTDCGTNDAEDTITITKEPPMTDNASLEPVETTAPVPEPPSAAFPRFTPAEGALIVRIDDQGKPWNATLSDIVNANQDADIDLEVWEALRRLVDGAPATAVGGGAAGLFVYTLIPCEPKDADCWEHATVTIADGRFACDSCAVGREPLPPFTGDEMDQRVICEQDDNIEVVTIRDLLDTNNPADSGPEPWLGLRRLLSDGLASCLVTVAAPGTPLGNVAK
jgi:hypothetical protein